VSYQHLHRAPGAFGSLVPGEPGVVSRGSIMPNESSALPALPQGGHIPVGVLISFDVSGDA
jgi:hypothetical protein